MKDNTAEKTLVFLYEHTITRFGYPLELVSDQGTHFLNDITEALTTTFKIKHSKAMTYYPRCNGQAESTKKMLKRILTKLVETRGGTWDKHLLLALWAYKLVFKVSIKQTPFRLVYGQEAIVPFEFMIPVLRLLV